MPNGHTQYYYVLCVGTVSSDTDDIRVNLWSVNGAPRQVLLVDMIRIQAAFLPAQLYSHGALHNSRKLTLYGLMVLLRISAKESKRIEPEFLLYAPFPLNPHFTSIPPVCSTGKGRACAEKLGTLSWVTHRLTNMSTRQSLVASA